MQSIRVLYVECSNDDIIAVETALKSFVVTGKKIASLRHQALEKALIEQPWDMLLIKPDSEFSNIEYTLSVIKALERELPLLALIEHYEPENVDALFLMGVTDILVCGEVHHTTAVIKREHARLQEKKRYKTDIKALKESLCRIHEANIHPLSYNILIQDLVTGIYNSAYIETQLNRVFKDEKANFNVMFIQLDAYQALKQNHDTHNYVNQLLRDVTVLIQQQAPETAVLGRVDEDVFAIIAEPLEDTSFVTLANNLRKSIELHQTLGKDFVLTSTASITLHYINPNSPIASQVLQIGIESCAELKRAGGNRIHHYQEALTKTSPDPHQAIVMDIQDAINEKRCHLVFQPIVSLHGAPREFYEVFFRATNASGHPILTEMIFAMDEQNHIIREIDRWVITHILKMLSNDRKQGHERTLFLILSEATLTDPLFLPWLSEQLNQYQVPGNALVFEIDERAIIKHRAQLEMLMKGMTELKSQIAINHFGLSMTSLSLLNKLPVTYVKMDGSYTQRLKTSKEGELELKAIIDAVHQQGMLTIVPLVEDANILSTLWRCGANYLQGYYLKMPDTFMDYTFLDEQTA